MGYNLRVWERDKKVKKSFPLWVSCGTDNFEVVILISFSVNAANYTNDIDVSNL